MKLTFEPFGADGDTQPGLLDIGKVQPGDLVVVSGAAEATASVVYQIARMKGARVLGLILF